MHPVSLWHHFVLNSMHSGTLYQHTSRCHLMAIQAVHASCSLVHTHATLGPPRGLNSPCVQCTNKACGGVQSQRKGRQGPKLKQLHWVKLNTLQQGTIWQRVDVSLCQLNFDQLEANFQVHTNGVTTNVPVTTYVAVTTNVPVTNVVVSKEQGQRLECALVVRSPLSCA